MDLVLRNNRTTDEYPYGIFHPHEELHHIKKENIGLIEVMGLAVLPGRLKSELDEIEMILSGDRKYDKDKISDEDPLYKHIPWIDELILKYGVNLKNEEAEVVLKDEVGKIFLKVLMDAGVFKRDEVGMAAFDRFLNSIDFKKI
jgi:UTP-hexose-1-phosphate uridylyltransferase (EC 2.7.7.10)